MIDFKIAAKRIVDAIPPDCAEDYEAEAVRIIASALTHVTKEKQDRISELEKDATRLKRGDFTPEEFQSLCHHRDEKPGCTREDFEAGCLAYQEKLFGPSSERTVKWDKEQTRHLRERLASVKGPPRTIPEALEECKKWQLTEEEVEGMLR